MNTIKTIIGGLNNSTSKICKKIVYSENKDFRNFLAFLELGTNQLRKCDIEFQYDETQPLSNGILLKINSDEDVHVVDSYSGTEISLFKNTPQTVEFQHIDKNVRRVLITTKG